jgi:hypothetical protein
VKQNQTKSPKFIHIRSECFQHSAKYVQPDIQMESPKFILDIYVSSVACVNPATRSGFLSPVRHVHIHAPWRAQVLDAGGPTTVSRRRSMASASAAPAGRHHHRPNAILDVTPFGPLTLGARARAGLCTAPTCFQGKLCLRSRSNKVMLVKLN